MGLFVGLAVYTGVFLLLLSQDVDLGIVGYAGLGLICGVLGGVVAKALE